MSNQLPLFAPEPELLQRTGRTTAQINVPDVIRRALDAGATLAVSISGGKDGQAMLTTVAPWFRANGHSGQLFAIHSDLGRSEWPQTPAFVEHLAKQADVPLIVTRLAKGDLVARLEERLSTLAGTGKPFWPSSGQRYCTSDLKRGPIDTQLRKHSNLIISAEGVRKQESKERAKKSVVEIRKGITASSKVAGRNLAKMAPVDALNSQQPGQRVAFNWRPIFYWSLEQVWEGCGTSMDELTRRRALYKLGEHEQALSGWPAHPAYVFGNDRLSCALCILGSKSDLLNGANHNPDLYVHYLKLEREGNATFKNGWSLSQLPVKGRAKELKGEFLSTTPEYEQ